MGERVKIPVGLVVFTAAYILVAGVSAWVNDNKEFIIYIGVMGVMIWAILTVHRRCDLSRGLLWSLSVWGLLHMAGGLVPIPEGWPYNGPNGVLYSLWLIPEKLKYDQVVHAYGFGITTWLCWEALRAGVQRRFELKLEPTVGVMVLCAAGGMGFGAFNEIVEFVATLTLPNTNVGGYVNTGWDLVYNMLGSVVGALVIGWRGRGEVVRDQ